MVRSLRHAGLETGAQLEMSRFETRSWTARAQVGQRRGLADRLLFSSGATAGAWQITATAPDRGGSTGRLVNRLVAVGSRIDLRGEQRPTDGNGITEDSRRFGQQHVGTFFFVFVVQLTDRGARLTGIESIVQP